MNINDGKGIFNKYGIIDEMKRKMDLIADTTGALRCGLIWDVACMLKALREGLQKDDEVNAQKVEELKRIIENKEAE